MPNEYESALPPELRAFIHSCVESITQVELLLMLRGSERFRAVREIADELGLPTAAARRDVETLAARALLEVRVGEETAYRFRPKTDDLARRWDLLAQYYITARPAVLGFVATEQSVVCRLGRQQSACVHGSGGDAHSRSVTGAGARGARRHQPAALRPCLGRRIMIVPFIHGAVSMGCAIAAVFFLRFWQRSRDRLFLRFSAAFCLLSVSYALLGTVAFATEWRVTASSRRTAADQGARPADLTRAFAGAGAFSARGRWEPAQRGARRDDDGLLKRAEKQETASEACTLRASGGAGRFEVCAWRRREGVEPSRASYESRTGFEDQRRHRAPASSGW